LGEEFRFHHSSRFRKKAGDAKFPFHHSFCVSFDVLGCGVLLWSGGVGTPAETPFTMGKELKEFQLCDSRRFRTKAQDAQDAVLKFLRFSVSVALIRRLRFLMFLRFLFSLPCNLQGETLF